MNQSNCVGIWDIYASASCIPMVCERMDAPMLHSNWIASMKWCAMDKLHSLIWLVSSIQWKFTTAILQSQLPSGKRLRNELENHQCSWVNPLFLWPCSSSQTLSLPEGKGWPSRYGPMAISSMAHVGDPGTGWTDGKRHFWIAAMKDQFIHMKNAINTYIYI